MNGKDVIVYPYRISKQTRLHVNYYIAYRTGLGRKIGISVIAAGTKRVSMCVAATALQDS